MGQNKCKLSPKNIQELVENTEFTELEVYKWYNSFMRDCPTGILTEERFKDLYQNFFPDGDANAFAGHVFRTFDVSGDGTIDFREFLCAVSVTSRGTYDQKVSWAYNMFDQDKDGHITKQEMLGIITALYKMTGERTMQSFVVECSSAEDKVDQIFDRMDKDGNAEITAEEFKIAIKQDPTLVKLLQVVGGMA